MDIRNSIIINRPPSEVFAFLSNFENMSKWNYYIVSVRKVTEGLILKGTVFHQVRKSDSQDYRIVTLIQNEEVMIETLPPERYVTTRFALRPEGSGTRIDDTITIRLPLLIDWFARLGAPRIQRAVLENLQHLKTLLETGVVTLQDGRVEKV